MIRLEYAKSILDKRIVEWNGVYKYDGYSIDGIDFSRGYVQNRAKELGYVNGYRWGIEYQTNGKKPDLPDNVLISVAGEFINGNWYIHEFATTGVNWKDSIKFKITDTRYKPADTSYLDNPTVKDSLTDDWWDYDNNKPAYNGALPPVGTKCEVYGGLGQYNEWQKCEIMAYHNDVVFVCNNENWTHRNKQDFQFRPLDWNREAEEDRLRTVKAVVDATQMTGTIAALVLLSAYDAGFLRIPEDK